uniref:Uncharacterized protein n=1 Tax=Romanomermis culicivorax TaxID=13658 RepID=A0A915JE46_ROMCU
MDYEQTKSPLRFTFAGLASMANPPPFKSDNFCLTVFNCTISAPRLLSSLIKVTLSSKVIPDGGQGYCCRTGAIKRLLYGNIQHFVFRTRLFSLSPDRDRYTCPDIGQW